jgi:hypothetical protein
MIRMPVAGGMPVVTDEVRASDSCPCSWANFPIFTATRSSSWIVLGTETPKLDTHAMAQVLERRRQNVLSGLRQNKSFDLLVADYPSLVQEPLACARRVAEFVGSGLNDSS